jgi:hypothetical protein
MPGKYGYLPNIFNIVPEVMIKFTDFIYITECPQVADRRCLLDGGDYDTQSEPKGVSCVESVTLLACMLDSPFIYFTMLKMFGRYPYLIIFFLFINCDISRTGKQYLSVRSTNVLLFVGQDTTQKSQHV